MSSTITDLSSLSQRIADLVEQTAAGVVAVKAAPYRVVSAVAVDNDLVALADHTLRREDRIPVEDRTGAQGAGTILGRDPTLDLAFLKVDGATLKPLPVAEAGSLKPGALAAIVGLTIDAGPTASIGILGAVGEKRRTWRGGTLDHFIRLDATLYPSQSGAAVVTAEGQLIGMATPALLRHSGVAVPMQTIRRVAEELRKEGRIRHGFVGVGLHPVVVPAGLGAKFGIAAESGLILLSVEPESPAALAGWQVGDILVSLDGQSMFAVEELQTVLRANTVGRTLKANLFRGGELLETQVTIAERKRKAK